MSYSVGFIGLGNMGLPMASNLATADCTVSGFDTQLTDVQECSHVGIQLCATLAQAIESADLIFTMLPNGAIVLDVLQQIIQTRSTPVTIIDCSTIDINDARQAHDLARQHEFGFLDAPVSGGIAGAAAGTLTTMVGGDEQLLVTIKPRLAPVFKNIVYCGAGGAGQAAKICNNMLLATSMIGVGETFNLGKKLGLDANTLYSILSTSTGSCWSVNSYCPVPGVGPTTPADNEYQPGFSAQMMLKDMNLTQSAAKSVELATPLGAHALALYNDYVNAGGGAEDFSGIIRYLEKIDRE
jgi:3-hydroxyisobutyrate dehydrogenase